MKKIAFVTPWYGDKIPGGAEMETRGVVKHLIVAGCDVEILTTCVKDFNGDWNRNYHPEGFAWERGVPVRRFKVRKRNTRAFDAVNSKLMNGQPVSEKEERVFIDEMINSPRMYRYIRDNKEDYDAFIFIPYMFGTTYFGVRECYDRAVLIPCFHDEPYLYLNIYKDVFERTAGMIFNARSEQTLANRVFNLKNVFQCQMGIGIDTDITYDPQHFRQKYDIQDPFILYAGRKDLGKNVDLLLYYFELYKKLHKKSRLKLVLIGGGRIDIPKSIRKCVYDLGFVEMQDKYDAYAAALLLCQPSTHESFSLVIMESWLCERPVLVHGDCEVTKDFTLQSNGGLFFTNYQEYEACLEFFENEPEISMIMGKNGKRFVLDSFGWDAITYKYIAFLNQIRAKH